MDPKSVDCEGSWKINKLGGASLSVRKLKSWGNAFRLAKIAASWAEPTWHWSDYTYIYISIYIYTYIMLYINTPHTLYVFKFYLCKDGASNDEPDDE